MMKRLKWMIASLICLPINTLAQGYTEATNYWIDKYQSVSYPLKSIHISSPYGIRADPFTGEKRNHQGIDLVATYEEIYAMFDGFIKTVGYDPIAGYYITLQVGNYTLSYCHLSEIWVKEQETVYAGDALGKTGTTGRATGPHLHLTCRLQGKIENPYLLLTFVRDTQQQRQPHLKPRRLADHHRISALWYRRLALHLLRLLARYTPQPHILLGRT